MDYRKPTVFGENWSNSRYRVLPYFAHEKPLVQSAERVLDLGCAAGWNMSRFVQYGARPIGLEVNPDTIRHARPFGPVTLASGRQLPYADGSFDLIYVQHVLHHIGDMQEAMGEIFRCLAPGGKLFLIETVEDNPIIKFGRNLHDDWMGDEINQRFSFATLQADARQAGFKINWAEQYSVLFWLWEILPDQIPALETFTPLATVVESVLLKTVKHLGAHCFLVLEKPH